MRKQCGQFDVQAYLQSQIGTADDGDAGGPSRSRPTIANRTNGNYVAGNAITANAIAANTIAYGFEDYHVYFESRYKKNTTTDEIQWFIPDINSGQEITDCIEIHLTDFYFPAIPVPSGEPNYYYYRRVFMELTNQPFAQSTLMANGTRFHFEFQVEELAGAAVRLVPKMSSIFFRSPINISDFLLRFYVPPLFERIDIPSEVVQGKTYINIPSEDQQLIITIPDTRVLGLPGTIDAPGERIILSNYRSYDDVVNAAVNTVHYVRTIYDANRFLVENIFTDPISVELPITVTIPKNRIALNVRFTCLRNRVTQRIGVNHE